MKIAVTSCSDPIDAPKQAVWSQIAAREPDHLVLLGDQIYMDYGIGPNPGLGEPAGFSDLKFAAEMYKRYRAQWQIMHGSGLWRPGLQVHGIWDDHDFAWNNSHGQGPGKAAVPPAKQQVSRRLFRQFFEHLRASDYPVNPLTTQAAIDGLAEDLDQPVFFSEGVLADPQRGLVRLAPDVNLLLTDGRSFRTAPGLPAAQGTLLGATQLDWLKQNIRDGVVSIVASGCTLDNTGEATNTEAWRAYRDYRVLRAFLDSRPQARVLLLSGDIHNTDLRTHHGPGLIEVVASGAARPFGNVVRYDRGNHALLEIGPTAIKVHRYEGEPPEQNWSRHAIIDRASWHVQH